MTEIQDPSIAEEIIALEKAGLDRWYDGDPGGPLELTAPSITYFDPWTPMRLDGRKALVDYAEPFAGQVHADRYEMLNPKVQLYGDIAILTFNLITYDRQDDATEKIQNRWNATDIYHRTEEGWEVVHMNWSYMNKESETTDP
jgi:hypothetical protein